MSHWLIACFVCRQCFVNVAISSLDINSLVKQSLNYSIMWEAKIYFTIFFAMLNHCLKNSAKKNVNFACIFVRFIRFLSKFIFLNYIFIIYYSVGLFALFFRRAVARINENGFVFSVIDLVNLLHILHVWFMAFTALNTHKSSVLRLRFQNHIFKLKIWFTARIIQHQSING